jgi:hypothetical protein
MLKIFAFHIFVICFSFSCAHNDDLLVKIKSGYVRGKSVQYQQTFFSSKRVNAWLGIPYAEKPIGDLRFKRPVQVKNWTSVLNTTEWPNSCFQVAKSPNDNSPDLITQLRGPVSEDCLYLNVWTPNPRPIKKTPVIVSQVFLTFLLRNVTNTFWAYFS